MVLKGCENMNLAKLFETQKALRDRINYQESDRFEKLILALLVEIGECANEWRGFKYWSTDQEPRTRAVEKILVPGASVPQAVLTNPLLEEYADGFTFVLELGLELAYEFQYDITDDFTRISDEIRQETHKCKDVTEQFIYLFDLISTSGYDMQLAPLFAAYYHLGEKLGFTWKQIEQAYYAKNKINHERQERGY